MTLYTDNRGYPYPASDREAGNGGLHSEQLATAVQRDLDDLDTQWAAELQHSTANLILNAPRTNLFANDANQPMLFDTFEHASSGLGLFTYAGMQQLGVAKGGQGWYHVAGAIRAGASGTITAAARHSLRLRLTEYKFGTGFVVREDMVDTYQAGTTDINITIESVMYLAYGQDLSLYYFHTNTGSSMTAQVAGTSLAATLLFRE